MDYEFVINGVDREEYDILKGDEDKIINEMIQSFNSHWRPKIEDIEITFKYNEKRKAIGIYLSGEEERLVLDSDGLNETEISAVTVFYRNIKENLDKYRILREEWES